MLSKWASGWAGAPLYDVESGYRIFRLGALAHALEFYSGYQYSETVEVAVVLCQLGYNVRNDHVVPVPVARSRTRLRDAAIDLAVIPVAAGRVWRRDRVPERRSAPMPIAHLSIAGVLGVSIALTLQRSTDTVFTIGLAALAAFGLGAVLRRCGPPPVARTARIVRRARRGVAHPATVRPVERDRAVGRLRRRRRAGRAGRAPPAPDRSSPARSRCFARRRDRRVTRSVVLGVAVGAVFVAAVVSRFGRFGFPRTHRLRTLALGSTLVVAVSGLTGYFGASTVGATWFGGGVVHGPRTSGEVAITFDDEPGRQRRPRRS